MSKWFEVSVTSVKVFAVEVRDDEDEDAAQNCAIDEAGDFADVTSTGPITDPIALDRCKRFADDILSLEGQQ